MKEHFTIGEISALTGLSSHALRYYDKIGLVRPEAVNDQTGYRLYSYLQLFTLDWIRHLQLLGFKLDQIREILSDTSAQTLVRHLSQRRQELDGEIRKLEMLRDAVDYYLKLYRGSSREAALPELPYLTREKARYVFSEPFRPGEPILRTAGFRLMQQKNRKEYRDLFFLRRAGYTLDYAALLEGQVRPENYYYMLGRRPERDIPAVRELPAGTYLCYRCRILSPGADLTPLLEILEKLQGEHMVIANESDDNLDDALGAYVQSQFELQVFLYP